jgi:hypothetical protein
VVRPLENALEAFWSLEFRNETLRSTKRMEAALWALLPKNPFTYSSNEWGNGLKATVGLGKKPVAAMLFSFELLQNLYTRTRMFLTRRSF